MVAGTAVASFCVQAIGTARLARLGREDLVARLRLLDELTDYGSTPLLG